MSKQKVEIKLRVSPKYL